MEKSMKRGQQKEKVVGNSQRKLGKCLHREFCRKHWNDFEEILQARQD
jgi:hypothetical protein